MAKMVIKLIMTIMVTMVIMALILAIIDLLGSMTINAMATMHIM